jgi:group I intron endonuclease
MKRKFCRVIYRLWHTQSKKGLIGYIGKDSHYPRRLNLEFRKKNTGCPKLYQALNKYPLQFWKTEVLASGFKSDRSLSKSEIYYIKKFDSKNKGYNCTDGGEGLTGWSPSLETRLKMSKGNKGRKFSAEHRRKIGESNKGRVISLEMRRHLSKLNTGKKHPKWGLKQSLKHRRRMQKIMKGNTFALGIKRSKETRRLMSEAASRRWAKYHKKT